MATRPNNLETTRLTIELLRRIPRNRWITAESLRQELVATGIDRTIRTVQRQLESVVENFDIECDSSSKPHGYRWKERSAGLSLQIMTEQESLLLMLAQQHLRNLLPTRLMKSMEGFFEQAQRTLQSSDKKILEREWLNKVRVVNTSQPLIPPKIQPEVFDAVSNALFANQQLELSYRNAKKQLIKDAHVMPLGLVQQGPILYLVCRFEGYDNERNLALHRIQQATVLPFNFKRPTGFDLANYDDDGRFHLGNGARIRVCFDLKKSVRATVVDATLFWNWLKGLDGELVEPPEAVSIS